MSEILTTISVNPYYGVLLIFFLVLFVLTYKLPLVFFSLFIISIFLPFRTIHMFYPHGFLFFPVAVGCFLRILTRKNYVLRGKKVIVFSIPFLLIIATTAIGSSWKLQHIIYFYSWLQLPLIYFFCLNLINNKREFRYVLSSFIIMSMFFAVYYFIFRLFFNNYNINIHYNIAAFYLGLALIFFLGLMKTAKSIKEKKMFLYFLIFLLLTLFLTGSRWGIFSSILVLLSFFVFIYKDSKKLKYYLFTFFGVIMIALILMYLLSPVLYERLLFPGSHLFQIRANIYKDAFILFRLNPLRGIGIGNFNYYTYYTHTHNIILEILVSTGLVGLGAFSFLIWGFVSNWIRLLGVYREHRRYIIYTAIACFIFFVFKNMLHFNLNPGIGAILGLILGIAEVIAHNDYTLAEKPVR